MITTAQNYNKIFSGIAELFDRISAFLDRFDVYVRSKSLGVEIDIHLRRIIHELLRCFLRICAISIKVSEKSKLLLALEVFTFESDKGVKDELNRLESLVQRETGMNVTLISESTKVTELNVISGFAETKGSLKNLDSKVDVMSEHLEQRENTDRLKAADGASSKNRERIRQALNISNETWRNDHEELVRTHVPRTGQWLLKDPQFIDWAYRKAPPIIALEGREGFGKSHISSVIIRHLHRHPPQLQGSSSRVSMAYYFFRKDNKDEKSVNKALRAVVWQLTQNNAVYQKAVSAACDNPEEFGESLELWKRLFVQIIRKQDTRVFIFLDGIDEARTEPGQPLLDILKDIVEMNDSGPSSIRVLITGRPETFAEIQEKIATGIVRVDLGTRNEEDITTYIDYRMDHMDILKKTDQPGIKDLRDDIRKSLTKGSSGDFFKLNYMLSEISTKRRKKEIQDVLAYAGEDRQDTIAREVERLSKTLGETDIQDLNELLAWVIGSKEWPLLSLLEGVLFVKNGEGSLVSLHDQIRDKYSGLLKIYETDRASIRSSSITKYFEEMATNSSDSTTENSSSLHPSEIAIVKRFLFNVCDEELYNKFGFEEFFRLKAGKQTTAIKVDFQNIHILILNTCLNAICSEEQRPELSDLLSYAFYWLPDHLDEVDLALTAPQAKSQIGSLLVKLFYEEECLNRWWTKDRMWMRKWWIYDDEYSDIVMKWFRDSAVIADLPKEQREWVRRVESDGYTHDDLLQPMARMISERWLRADLWDGLENFWVLLGYMTKVGFFFFSPFFLPFPLALT